MPQGPGMAMEARALTAVAKAWPQRLWFSEVHNQQVCGDKECRMAHSG